MIRPYTPSDKDGLIEILRLNTPRYFDASEEKDFMEYLEHHVEQYYVYESNGRVIGSGGINYFNEEKLARISWDMIHPDLQGRGIGAALLSYRIEEIKKRGAVDLVQVRTTQWVYKFYQKMGFELERTEKDYWAKGFDLYQMKLQL